MSTDKIIARTENQVTIYKNAIIQKKNINLYYLMNLYNYSAYTEDSISIQLTNLYNFIINLETQFKEIKFTLYRYEDVVSTEEYVENLIETIRLWDKSFRPTQEFLDNVQFMSQNYCFLMINIDQKSSIDFNAMNVKDAIKEVGNQILDVFANDQQQSINTSKIDAINTQILNMSQSLIRPCPERILVSYYIKQIFPSYNLVIRRKEYDNTKAILGYLQQEFIPHFNYFEMTNVGVEYFNAKPVTTYGCIIDILEFPTEINSEIWSLSIDGLIVNTKTLTKDQARVKFLRKKSDIEYEEESAIQSGGRQYNLELSDFKDIVDTGLAAISLNKKIVECDIHILITSSSVEKLNKYRAELISNLKSQDVVATFSPKQAKTYVDSFIKLRPEKYPFLMDLRYPFAFKLDNGAFVGDYDSKFQSPIVGEIASKAEAVGTLQ